MANIEVDAAYLRNLLRLLHSSLPDSTDQILAIHEEAVRQKYGNSKTLSNNFSLKKSEEAEPSGSPNPAKRTKTSESGKSSTAVSPLSTSQSPTVSSSSSPVSSPIPTTVSNTTSNSSNSSNSSSLSSISTNVSVVSTMPNQDLSNEDLYSFPIQEGSELTLDILEDDLTCVVCRGMDVGARNQLVECLECHSLYHQECHQPPIAEADMNDPRSAWYCSNCTKAINKVASKSSARSISKLTPNTSRRELSAAPTKVSSKSESSQNLFKRNENKGTSGNAASSKSASTSNMGMAGLAASLQPVVTLSAISKSYTSSTTKSTYVSNPKTFGGSSFSKTNTTQSSSKVSSNSSSSNKCVMPNINIITADKRLQNMKKKAAKLQEKRKHSK